MKPMIRTAVALVGAAGAASAALMLHRSNSSAATRSPNKAPESPVACGSPGAAHAEAKLTHGRLGGAMSAGTLLRNSGGEAYAAFELTTENVADKTRPPLDLALVIDHSGSMSDGRIEHAKSAALGLISHLGEQDHVALVEYDDAADVLVSSTAMDDHGKDTLRHAIERIQLGGGTNLNDGLVLGRKEVERVYTTGQVSRLILLSDGHANVGVTETPRIAETARDAANHGTRITSVGIGLDFNEDLMEAIAEAGRGNYHYVREATDLDKVIAGEMAAIQATVATNVELRLTPACNGVEITAIHGYESHKDGASYVIPMADLVGNDSRKLLVSMKVPDGQKGRIGTVHAELVYRDAKGSAVRKANVDLGLEVGEDAAVASASIDQNVMAQALQIDAAASMRQAADAYEHGDQAGAAQIIDSSTRRIQDKGARYKIAPEKTADTMNSLGEMQKKATEYKPGSDEGKDMLKASKSKARVMSKK
ncbi:MAG TPA: VWA domain-containing protein [Kofleriaceae bacterium]|nr:VWA domain-containing protein [Kofleriaceae bacterium]